MKLATNIEVNLEADTLISTLLINGGGMTYIDRTDIFQQTFDSGTNEMNVSSAQIFRVNLASSPGAFSTKYSIQGGITSPVVVTVVAGTVATGCTLTADGLIGYDLAGTPNTVGHYIITMKVQKTAIGTPDSVVVSINSAIEAG
jgi:hypothetical protein